MGYGTGARSRLIYCAETVEGTTPAVPSWKTIRRTAGGSGITVGRSTLESAELRSDRQTPVPQLGNKSIGINVPLEFSFGSFDDFLESILAGAFAADVLVNGVTRKTFTFEEGFLDLDTPLYQAVVGAIVNSMSLSISNNAKVTGSFELLGLAAAALATSSLASSVADPTETDVFDSFTGSIHEGGTAFEAAQSLSLQVEASGKHSYALYNDDPAFNSLGRIKITGTLVSFFKDAVLANKFLNKTPSSIAWTLTDGAGNDYLIELPYIVYTGASKTIPEDDIPVSLPFTAGVDPVSGVMIKITRTAA